MDINELTMKIGLNKDVINKNINKYLMKAIDEIKNNPNLVLDGAVIIDGNTANIKDNNQLDSLNELRIITRDEYLLENKMFNKKLILESWEKLSKGFNLMFIDANGNYYSVDFVNNRLSKTE